ncbi:MAG: FkbM family methyltransferase [Pyrinomonadaceae bacterium]
MNQILKSLANKFGFEVTRVPRTDRVIDADSLGELDYYKTPHGNYYVPRDAPDDVIINCIKSGKVFEPEIVETAKKYITKGSVVLDVGANFGQMSVLFSDIAGGDGIVYAFEADDFVFDVLEKNIEANVRKNIEPVFGAVFNESGKELFFPKQDFKRFAAYGSYGIDPNARAGRKVTSLMIDDIEFTKPVSFMKVDVQGSDLFAMQGAIETIRKHRMPILFEFEQQFQDEFGTSFQDYVKFIDSIGYEFSAVINQINYLVTPK